MAQIPIGNRKNPRLSELLGWNKPEQEDVETEELPTPELSEETMSSPLYDHRTSGAGAPSFDPSKLPEDIAMELAGTQQELQIDEPRTGGVNFTDKDLMEKDMGIPVMSGNDFAQESPTKALLSSLGDSVQKATAPKKELNSSVSEPVLRYMAKNGDQRAKKLLEDVYGPELNDRAFKGALDEQARKEDLLDWNTIGGQFGKAYARSSGYEGEFDPTSDYTKKKMKESDRDVKAIEKRRKGKDNELTRKSDLLDLDNKKQTSSADSEISQMAREFAQNKLGMSVSDSVSYDAMKGLMGESRQFKQFEEQVKAREATSNAAREDRLMRHSEMMNDKEQNRDLRRNNAYRGFVTSPPAGAKKAFDKITEQKGARDEVLIALEGAKSGNQAALASLGTKLARYMGEVGVLTDADVTRYIGGASWARKANDWFSKGAKGELSIPSHDDINSLLKGFELAQEKRGYEIYDDLANQFISLYPEIGSLEEARKKLGDPRMFQSKPKTEENKTEQKSSEFPKQVRNLKTGEVAIVSNSEELKEANSEGFM